MKRPTAQGPAMRPAPPVYPSYEHIRKTDDVADMVERLIAFGRPRAAAERAMVIAYVLRGYRPPGLNQLVELNALAMMLKGMR